MKTVKIDINNNDTVIPLMSGAIFDLHDLVNDKIVELKNEIYQIQDPSEGEEIQSEILHYRAIRNRLDSYL